MMDDNPAETKRFNDQMPAETRKFNDESNGTSSGEDKSNQQAETKKFDDAAEGGNPGETRQLQDNQPAPAPAAQQSNLPNKLHIVFPDGSKQVFTAFRPYLIIGRKSKKNRAQVDIDMTQFDVEIKSISRLHAMIQADADTGMGIKDLNSTNGTQLNGRQLKPSHTYMLKDGDRIKLGNLKLQVYFE